MKTFLRTDMNDFDPYEALIQCTRNIEQISSQLSQQAKLNEQIIHQLNSITEVVNNHYKVMIDFNSRVQLLELARQHESKTTTENLDTDTNNS